MCSDNAFEQLGELAAFIDKLQLSLMFSQTSAVSGPLSRC